MIAGDSVDPIPITPGAITPGPITPGGITPGARAVAFGRPSLPAVSTRGQAASGGACRNARGRDLRPVRAGVGTAGSLQNETSTSGALRQETEQTLETIVRTRTAERD